MKQEFEVEECLPYDKEPMARILVLTVDRDNDLGIKTSIRGPVVGRRQVLTAALKLGIADPEESDTNAILGALSQHDLLLENGADEDEVEVAILTGDEKVGVRSDRAISAQLEEVVSSYQPDEAILITDGAEDEAVLPIIQSQVRIDHVEKIIVKQSKGIEGTYYYIVKALEDPKWRASIYGPSWPCSCYLWARNHAPERNRGYRHRKSSSSSRIVHLRQRRWNRNHRQSRHSRDARKR